MAGAKRSASKADTPAGLAALIKAAPKLSSPKEARARVDEWLGEIARTPPARRSSRCLPPTQSRAARKLADLVAAIAEGSPYLWDLIRADPDRLLGVARSRSGGAFRRR